MMTTNRYFLNPLILTATLLVVTLAGCAVSRGQESVGAYVDDAGITSMAKSRMFEDKTVSGSSISVETLNGMVQLSGFAKSYEEKMQAENIVQNIKGVKSIRNNIIIRP
jgi:hyperosmotically inducible periplasmic protein